MVHIKVTMIRWQSHRQHDKEHFTRERQEHWVYNHSRQGGLARNIDYSETDTYLDVPIDVMPPERLDAGLHSGVFGTSCASISLQAYCHSA
jgi:hypothetical protein